MCSSSICETIVDIYFNCNFGLNPSRWINSSISRHFQFAFRILISFVVSSFLIYGTRLKDHFQIQFLIPNLSILLIGETFGLTLSTNIELIFVLIPLSFYLFLLQKSRFISPHYLFDEFSYLFSSFLIGYTCKRINTRNFSLLFNSIYFVRIINEINVPLIFPFQLLESFSIGMLISLIVSLFVFPLFATFDIQNRLNYCLSHLQQMYHLLIQAFLSEEQISAYIFLSQVNIIEKMIRETMIQVQSRFDESCYEPSRLLQKLFNRKKVFLDLTLQGLFV
jgi:hypothetical protein